MYVNDDSLFLAKFNTWETKVIEAEVALSEVHRAKDSVQDDPLVLRVILLGSRCSSKRPQGGRTGAMQDRECELPRIDALGRWANSRQ